MEGAASLTIVNRDLDKADRLLARLASHARETALDAAESGEDAEQVVRSADLVVNATPLGMRPDDPSPVDASWLHSGQTVADMVYRPTVTPLLAAAAAAGATAVGGLGMLVAQGAVSIEIWNGESPQAAPRGIMRAAAEAELARQHAS
jgi:shikimate dehydrogenase